LFGKRAQVAWAGGKVDGGHLIRVSRAAETSVFAAKCKITAGRRHSGAM
jgi:hypothetical protein